MALEPGNEAVFSDMVLGLSSDQKGILVGFCGQPESIFRFRKLSRVFNLWKIVVALSKQAIVLGGVLFSGDFPCNVAMLSMTLSYTVSQTYHICDAISFPHVKIMELDAFSYSTRPVV